MSALALALALSISPAAAPDKAAVAPPAKQKASTKKTRRSRRRNHRSAAAQKSLASALALDEGKAAPAPRAPALPPASKDVAIGSIAAKTPTLSVPKTGIPFSNLFWPCLVLIGATGLVFALRRKSSGLKSMRVVEQIAVGRGRDIVIVEIGSARMLLGATDGGISVLERSLPRATRAGHPTSTAPQAAAPEGGLAAALASTLRRMKERVTAPATTSTASFESHLDGEPCSEHEEIRLKLKQRLCAVPVSQRNEEAHVRERTNPRFDASALRTNTVRA